MAPRSSLYATRAEKRRLSLAASLVPCALVAILTLALVPLLLTATSAPPSAQAAARCTFERNEKTKRMVLRRDCVIKRPLVIDNGWTLDGNGHTIKVALTLDPNTGVLAAKRGGKASIVDLNMTLPSRLDGGSSCDAAAIRFGNATGKITKVVIDGPRDATCGEGITASGANANLTVSKVTVRNVRFGFLAEKGAHLTVTRSRFAGKGTGVSFFSRAHAALLDSKIERCRVSCVESIGAGPVTIRGNKITRQTFDPDRLGATGIHLFGGMEVNLEDNKIVNMEIGIRLIGRQPVTVKANEITVPAEDIGFARIGIWVHGGNGKVSRNEVVAAGEGTCENPESCSYDGIAFDDGKGSVRGNKVSGFTIPGSPEGCGIRVQDSPGVQVGTNQFPPPPNERNYCILETSGARAQNDRGVAPLIPERREEAGAN